MNVEAIAPKHLDSTVIVYYEINATYDYNCYLEDDIVIRDQDFRKLRKFNECFGNEYLLQPNRIETSENLANLRRFYIDGDYNPNATIEYRKSMSDKLCLEHLGERVMIGAAGQYTFRMLFLNQKQSEKYFEGAEWSKQDTTFHGPLESAATLGVMKDFK